MPKRKEKPIPKHFRQCGKCASYFNPRSLKGAAHLASCRIYNGWVNYETWNVSLWIDNEEGSYRYWREVAQECKEEAAEPQTGPFKTSLTVEERTLYLLAKRLEEEIKDGEGAPDLGATMYADLLGAALSEVDWREIARHMLEK